jgi:hypothetical protein
LAQKTFYSYQTENLSKCFFTDDVQLVAPIENCPKNSDQWHAAHIKRAEALGQQVGCTIMPVVNSKISREPTPQDLNRLRTIGASYEHIPVKDNDDV